MQIRLGGVRLLLLVSQRPKSLAYKQYVREHRCLVELHQRDPKKFPMDLLARAVVAKFKSLNPTEIAALDKKEQTRNRQAQIRRSRAQERKTLKEEKDREKEIAKALAKEEREGDRKSAGKRDRKSAGKSALVLIMINFNLIITQ